MKNVEDILIILIKRISINSILKAEVTYNNNTKKDFVKLVFSYMDRYSKTEVGNLYDYLSEYIGNVLNQTAPSKSKKTGINVFDLMLFLVQNLLEINNNKVVCRYYQMLEWRKLNIQLSEDMFTCAFLAAEDLKLGHIRKDFFWEANIGHNNHLLNRMMEKGISENHFHLWASAPYFQLFWVIMMNNADTPFYQSFFHMMDQERLFLNVHYDIEYSEPSASSMYLRAILLRAYLYAWLVNQRIKIGEYYLFWEEIEPLISVKVKKMMAACIINKKDIWLEGKKNQQKIDLYKLYIELEKNVSNPYEKSILKILLHLKEEEAASKKLYQYLILNKEKKQTVSLWEILTECLSKQSFYIHAAEEFLNKDMYEKFWWEKTFDNVKRLLNSADDIGYYQGDIQSVVIYLREQNHELKIREEDYILRQIQWRRIESLDTEILYCGERWFLYHMFRRIYRSREIYYEQFNWFYAYLVIKETFRREVMQANDKIGLLNFKQYNSRKNAMSYHLDAGLIANLALEGTLKNKNIRCLEARISPKETAEEDRKLVEMLDYRISDKDKKRCYYVFHFSKEKDVTPIDKNNQLHRHYEMRQKLRRQVCALATFRERYPLVAKRVLGIDACSMEIGCRPEIFGPAFRYLRNHTVTQEVFGILETIPQLKITYHVGEDYLDMVDGLRAVDEAIHFLRLNCGDRMGHALVLGENVENWYKRRNHRILLQKQDYLDNIVWMYGRLIDFCVTNMGELLHYLEKEFEYYFRDIYGGVIPSDSRDYTILSYYYSQKLRGDNPECYRTGEYRDIGSIWDTYDKYSVNYIEGEKKDYRKLPEAVKLYYLYHYSSEVRLKGKEMLEINIPYFWYKGVEMLQKKLQEQVAVHGISIETNPSSNVMIGSFGKYEEHPIVKFYNHDLVADTTKVQECAQICVSINTDDKGVFATSLENEYGLMACSLELLRDERGNIMYDRMMIYEWMDHIREFGNMQCFKEGLDIK